MKRDMNELRFHLRPTLLCFILYRIFTNLKKNVFVINMASGRSELVSFWSDEKYFFAGFAIKEIGQMCQDRQRRQEQESLDGLIEAMIDLQPQENINNSDVEVFPGEKEEDGTESSNEETAAAEDVRPNAIYWSTTLREITVEEFPLRHGATRDLGDNASAKDFFNFFFNDGYLDKIPHYTVAYAHSKRDNNFTTKRADISAFLRLNIFIEINELPQLQMYWDSDEFIGVEGFKPNNSKAALSSSIKVLPYF